jgi:hypothetical protein
MSAMSMSDKLALGSTAAKTIGGAMQPSPEEIAQAQAKARGHQGALYGVNAAGAGPGLPSQGPKQPQSSKSRGHLMAQPFELIPTKSQQRVAEKMPTVGAQTSNFDLFGGFQNAFQTA